MAGKEGSRRSTPRESRRVAPSISPKEVPIQVMVPEPVRRQVALMGAERGESIRTVVLRGLQAVGIRISDSELTDRRGRRRNGRGNGHGAQ
jgi:hypothetical protein